MPRYIMVVRCLGVVLTKKTMQGIPLFSLIVGMIGSKVGERTYKQ